MTRATVSWLVSALIAVCGAAQAEVIAVTGGTVFTLGDAGTLEGATVLIEDGQITRVARGIGVPEGATVIDASGMVVTPGLFAAHTQLGLAPCSWPGCFCAG